MALLAACQLARMERAVAIMLFPKVSHVPVGFDERMAVLGPYVVRLVPLTQTAEPPAVWLWTARRWLAQYRGSGSAGWPGRFIRTG